MNINTGYIKDAVKTIEHNKALLNRIQQIWPFTGSPLIHDIMVSIRKCELTLDSLDFAAYVDNKEDK